MDVICKPVGEKLCIHNLPPSPQKNKYNESRTGPSVEPWATPLASGGKFVYSKIKPGIQERRAFQNLSSGSRTYQIYPIPNLAPNDHKNIFNAEVVVAAY